MSIKVYNQKSNITVYDNVNIKHATKEEVLHLTIDNNKDYLRTIIKIIADSLYLNDSERELYYILSRDTVDCSPVNKDKVINTTLYAFNKTAVTYHRAIKNLIIKGVIRYHNNYNDISLTNTFNVNTITKGIKYIVIDVKDAGDDSE